MPKLQSCAISYLAFFAALPSVAMAQADNSATLNEIVVTAQKREENLQKIPIAITAISNEQLRNAAVSRPEDLTRLVPGLAVFRAFGGMNNIYIRGIGAQVANAFGDQAVAQSLDGVYVARGTALSGAFLDTARIEVLKGPQGTLYGRNATGGAVNYISNKPEFTFKAGASAQLGNYSDREFEGFLNIPFGDKFAVRGAVGYIKHDGYIETSKGNDQDTLATRLSAKFLPNDNVSLLVVADYSQDRGAGVAGVVLNRSASKATAITSDPWHGPPLGYYAPANYDGTLQNPGAGCTLAPGPNTCRTPNTVTFNPALFGGAGGYALNPDTVGVWKPGSFIHNDNGGLMAQLGWTLGNFAELTVIPAYRYTQIDSSNTQAGINNAVDTIARQTSVETRLASLRGGRLNWLVGGFYYNEDQDVTEDYWNFNQVPGGVITNQGTVGRRYQLSDKSLAAFGQATYSLTKQLRVTAGLRYTYEEKQGTGHFLISEPAYVDIGTPFCPIGVQGTTYILATSQCSVPLDASRHWDALNWKAGVEYDVTPSSMLYVTGSTGFHAGGLNDGITSATYKAYYEPEKIRALAVGSKNRFLNGRLQLNAEAFYWKFLNKQYAALSIMNPPVVSFPYLNVGDLKEYGLDVDANFLLTENDLFGLSLQYLHSEYGSFVFGPTSTVDCPATGRFVPLLGIPIVNCAGKSEPNAPKWSTTMSYQHTVPLADDGKLVFGVRSHIESSADLTIGAPAWARQGDYSKTDLWLTYAKAEGKYSITAYVNNIERTQTYSFAQQSLNSLDTTWFGYLAPPRTYGVRVKALF